VTGSGEKGIVGDSNQGALHRRASLGGPVAMEKGKKGGGEKGWWGGRSDHPARETV